MVKEWLADPDRFPEAIICANDYMAITVCHALAERGIMVPRDIAVSGCDNIEVTKDFSPPLSTVGIPVSDMGKEAVDKIHNMNNNTPQEETTYLRYITYIRESCGCEMSKKTTDVYEGRNNIIRELENRDEIISNTAYMSINLTGVTTLEDLKK